MLFLGIKMIGKEGTIECEDRLRGWVMLACRRSSPKCWVACLAVHPMTHRSPNNQDTRHSVKTSCSFWRLESTSQGVENLHNSESSVRQPRAFSKPQPRFSDTPTRCRMSSWCSAQHKAFFQAFVHANGSGSPVENALGAPSLAEVM